MMIIDRTHPPATPELPSVRLPAVQEARLANGLTVLLVEDRRFPLVTVRLGFQTGSKHEPAELAGLAETTAALLTEGTRSRTAKQIADETAALGGSVHADASPDAMVVSAHALVENTERLLEIVADVTRNATFPEDELDLRKQNRKQELLAQLSDAGYLADEELNRAVFGPHPYARQEPTLESIGRLERPALASFRDAHVRPNGAVMVLLGDLPANAIGIVERHFEDWRPGAAPASPSAVFPPPRRSVVLVDRPGSVQADIRIGRLAVTRTDPRYFPLVIANAILGGGASSRLFTNVREAKGFAYDARSVAQPLRDAGMFAVVTQVRNEVLREALDTVLDDMRRIGREPAAADELATVKNYLSGTFVIRLETQDSVAAQIAGVKLMGLDIDYLERYTERVRAVDAEAARDAAAHYIDPENASLIVVGDAAALARQLESFGKVRVEKAPS